MSRAAPQLNVRSAVARERAEFWVRQTGMTTAQVVEAALLAWSPPLPADEELPPGLIRKGRFLVLAAEGRPTVTLEQALAAEQEARDERDDWVMNPRG